MVKEGAPMNSDHQKSEHNGETTPAFREPGLYFSKKTRDNVTDLKLSHD